MSWLGNLAGAAEWLASEGAFGRDPQVAQRLFQQFGASAESFASWYGYAMSGHGTAYGGDYNVTPWLTHPTAGTPPKTPSQSQPTALNTPQGIDPNTIDAILRAANETGVPPALALAIAEEESGFDPNAHHVSPTEDSWGVFQLNTKGGEGQGQSQYVLQDPYLNAKVALTKVAQVMRENPGMSWDQVAVTAQGADNTNGSYTTAIQNNLDQIESKSGSLAWANAWTQNPKYGGIGASTLQPGRSGTVAQPFPSNYFQNVSLGFGQQWNGETEQGTDFGMPEGTQLVTPVGGRVHTVDDGQRNWGRAVYITMPNGWTYFVGHMMDFTVNDGQQVAAGQVIGTSGGGPRSPSPGFSNGPHVEIRFIDPAGRNQDPMNFLRPIFQGVTFNNWAGGLFVGANQVAGQTQDLHQTPDGHWVDYGTQEGAWYQQVNNLWMSIYGTRAPLQAALDFQSAGINSIQKLQQAFDNLPSPSIAGVTVGEEKNLRDTVNKQAQASFGRPVPDSLLQEFVQQGITTANDVQLWFRWHSSSDIPKSDYQGIYDAASKWSQSIWGDVPHPSDVASIWQQSGGYGNQPSPWQTPPQNLNS